MIEARNLSKSYFVRATEDSLEEYPDAVQIGRKLEIRAVNDATFALDANGVVGLIGVNGAGKSTLIKLMTGILTPTSGDLTVFGRDPYKHRIKNNLRLSAVFGQRSGLLWDLPVVDSYELLRRMYRVPLKNYEKYIESFGKIFEIHKLLSRPVRTLSLGQKMLAELCGAFIHDPEIVFLDEPTIGLDVFNKDLIIEFLKSLKANKKCLIIMTTHDLDDFWELSDRLLILDKGRIVFDDLTAAFERQHMGTDGKALFVNAFKHFVSKEGEC